MRLGAATKLIGFAIAVAVPAAACTGGSGDETATTATPRETSTAAEPQESATVLPPSDFTAKPGTARVVLSWAPAPDGDAERFAIYRNDSPLTILPGSATTYTDESVVPGEEYAYEIEARAGATVAERVLVSTKTTLPPLNAARLAGDFNAKGRFESKTGYGDYSKPTYGWKFRPRCVEGPCNVAWSDLHSKPIRATLKRSGSRYRGSFTGKWGMECGGSPMTSSVTIDLRVDAAKVVEDEWRATRLVGTLDQTDAAQLGCRAGEARIDIRASLVQ